MENDSAELRLLRLLAPVQGEINLRLIQPIHAVDDENEPVVIDAGTVVVNLDFNGEHWFVWIVGHRYPAVTETLPRFDRWDVVSARALLQEWGTVRELRGDPLPLREGRQWSSRLVALGLWLRQDADLIRAARRVVAATDEEQGK